MKQLIAMLDAETLLLCTACGQNEAAFETKDPQTLRAAVTVPAAESCGTKYTLAQLMDYALRYSDNTAYYMLVTKFGAKGFNQMVRDWGYQNISISVSSRFPALTAAFMTDAMRRMYAQRNAGECMARAGQL